MIDAFHMYCIEIFCDELFAKSYFPAFPESSLQNFIPTICLKDGYIVISFEFADFISNFHPLTQQLQQLIIKMIDLLAQLLQRSMEFF